MYTIREDGVKKLLILEVSGGMRTEEALRAISQSFTLAEASGIRAIRCDILNLTKGPAGLLMLAASVALRHQTGMRVAIMGTERQLKIATRLTTFSGLRDGMKAFDSNLEADTWLRPALASSVAKISSTARRHAEAMLGMTANTEPQAASMQDAPVRALGLLPNNMGAPRQVEIDEEDEMAIQKRANPAA